MIGTSVKYKRFKTGNTTKELISAAKAALSGEVAAKEVDDYGNSEAHD